MLSLCLYRDSFFQMSSSLSATSSELHTWLSCRSWRSICYKHTMYKIQWAPIKKRFTQICKARPIVRLISPNNKQIGHLSLILGTFFLFFGKKYTICYVVVEQLPGSLFGRCPLSSWPPFDAIANILAAPDFLFSPAPQYCPPFPLSSIWKHISIIDQPTRIWIHQLI